MLEIDDRFKATGENGLKTEMKWTSFLDDLSFYQTKRNVFFVLFKQL